jgi:hypothetical protein
MASRVPVAKLRIIEQYVHRSVLDRPALANIALRDWLAAWAYCPPHGKIFFHNGFDSVLPCAII